MSKEIFKRADGTYGWALITPGSRLEIGSSWKTLSGAKKSCMSRYPKLPMTFGAP